MGMTKAEFIDGYAHRSGIPKEKLLKHMEAQPCDCGEGTCKGWKMVSQPADLERRDRLEKFAEIQQLLGLLTREVCPHCAGESPTYCEVFNGEHLHVAGVCEASTLRVLGTHVDDLRHQFANEFNPEQEPRTVWHCSNAKEKT